MSELILNATHPYSSINGFQIHWMGYVVFDRSQLAELVSLEWSVYDLLKVNVKTIQFK